MVLRYLFTPELEREIAVRDGAGLAAVAAGVSRMSLRRIANASGATVVGLHALAVGPSRGLVVMPSSYSKQIRHYAILSAYLNRHGFDTFRFDLTNHVGMSDGEIRQFSMSSMVDDIKAVLASDIVAGYGVSMVAFSLSARAAIRAWAELGRAEQLVLVMPVVNPRATLVEATGIDVFAQAFLDRLRPGDGVLEVMGYDVGWQFGVDGLASRLADLADTAEDLDAVSAPIATIFGSADEWVVADEVTSVLRLDQFPERTTLLIEDASHDLAHNPPVLRLLVEAMLQVLDPSIATVGHMSFDEAVAVAKQERRWAADGYRELEGGL